MAVLTRAQIIAKINLYITTNGNKEITGAQLNEILQDMTDSGFLQLDEIRTALSVSYPNVGNPANWNGGFAPATQNLVNDQLAERMSLLETENYSDSVAYVSKQGNDSTAELGNERLPFLTIQAAANAIPSNNATLIVLGGGTYTENVILKNTSTNCVFDFRRCTINGDFRAQFNPITNNCTITNLTITGGAIHDIRSTYLSNILFNTTTFLVCNSTFVSRSIFISSTNVATIRTQGLNSRKYYDTCVISNTGTGNAIDRSSYTTLNNCFIEANTGDAINNEASAQDVEELIRVYNSRVKSAGFCVDGENGLTNLIAENTIFYSTGSNIINQGGNTLFGTLLNFKSCDFYVTGSNDVFKMNEDGVINRLATENYTFDMCLFYTDTGFPVQEPINYNVSDAGQTLLINCKYNAATVTSGGAGSKITNHNPFQFTNYTNFNTLI